MSKTHVTGKDGLFDIFIAGEQLRVQMTEQGLVKDRRKGLRKHRQCFVAREAVDWAVRLYHVTTREEAVDAMNVLITHGLIQHVGEDQKFKDVTSQMLRFTRDDDTYLAHPELTAFYRGVELYRRLKKSGSNVLREMYVKGQHFPEAFHGCDLLDFCCMRGTDRSDAIAQASDMLTRGVIGHVSGGLEFLDDQLVYEFRLDFNKPCILVDVLAGVRGHAAGHEVSSVCSGQSSTSEVFMNAEETVESKEGERREGSRGGEPPGGRNDVTSRVLPSVPTELKVKGQHFPELLAGSAKSSGGMPEVPGTKLSRLVAMSRHSDDVSNRMKFKVRACPRQVTSTLKGDSKSSSTSICVHVQRDVMGYGFVMSGNSPPHVVRVDPLGPAARAGVKPHHVVSHVDDDDVTGHDHSHVARMLCSRDHVTLTLLTDRGETPRRNA